MKDLKVTLPNGEIMYLPKWCETYSDEEIAEAKENLIQACSKPIKEEEYTSMYSEEEWKEINRQLRKEGYTRKQIEEINARVECGESLDSAMQSV